MVITFSKVTLEWDFYIVKSIANIPQCEIFEKFPIKSRKDMRVWYQFYSSNLDWTA